MSSTIAMGYAQSLGSGAAMARPRLVGLLDDFTRKLETLEQAVISTSAAADRLGGDAVSDKGPPGNTPAPARIALLGSLEDSLQRLGQLTDRLTDVNGRLNQTV